MKKRKLPRVLACSLATMLVVGTTSISVCAADTTGAISSISGYSVGTSGQTAQAQAELKAKAQGILGSVGYVDANKSTRIQFNGSPVVTVDYDGNAHGLTAGVYSTLAGTYVADANMYYVGVTADGVYYSSSAAPTEPGKYYVAASYPGSNDYYPIIAYGIIIINKVETPDPSPVDPDPVDPDPKPDPDPTPDPDPDKPDPDPDKPDPDPDKPDPDPDKPDPDPDKPNQDDNKKDDNNNDNNKDNNNDNNKDNNKTTTKTSTDTTKKTDKKADSAKKETSPKTGDSSNYVVYMGTLMVAGAAIIVTLSLKRRKH